jgi:uncharacterized membrane protein (DUF2068 family)
MSEFEPKVAPWEDFVLRLIAIYKLIKAAVFIALGVGLLHFVHRDINAFLNEYVLEHNIDPENNLISHLVDWALKHPSSLTSGWIKIYSYVAFFYASIFALEGIGLYLRKHWAEYFVVIVTGSFLPLEFYETYRGLALWKFAVILGNLLIVAYLIHRLILDAKFKENEAKQKELVAEAEEPASKPVASKVTS